MYRKHKRNREIELNGIKINIPPNGVVFNIMTNAWEERDILSRSAKPAYQYWERPQPPADYEIKRKKEMAVQKTNPEYYNPELQNYRNQEWDRRLNGLWFYNNGRGTYLTGLHYFYLTHWKLDVGYPEFRITDLHFFYFLEYCVQDPNCMGMIEVTKRRQGKCLKINELVRMFDGSVKKVQDIKDGEYVMGDDSTARLVYGVTSGKEEMFDVMPKKGKGFGCNKSHILHCIKNVKGEYKDINISIEEYLKLSDKQKSLLMMRRSGWGNNYSENNHIVDPYFMGVWLGDGSSKGMQITNEDKEVTDYLIDYAKENNLIYKNFGQESKSGNKLQHYLGQKNRNILKYKNEAYESKEDLMRHLGVHIKTPLKTFKKFKDGEVEIIEQKSNKVWAEFLRLELYKNKHIPKEYLIDSEQNRLKLLCGLIDTDGTYIKGKHYQITFSNNYYRLQNDVKELIQSLGFYCGEITNSGSESKTFTIFGDYSKLIYIKIERKKPILKPRKYNSLFCGFDIKSSGEGDYYGFAVDGNNLFLLADGTVVHNTMRAGAFLFELTSRSKNKNAGIQSKTFDDAKDNVFAKGVIMPFKYLPDFFIPIYDTEKGMTPKGELRFFKTNKRGANDDIFTEKVELESMITFKSSDKFAYDGMKIHRYLADEAGKTKNVDVYDRHQVVQFCLQQEETIIGKALYTTTVEEMEDGGESFKALWQASDQNKKNTNGRTKSGLYQYFMPAYKTLFYDKYGIPDEDKAKEFYMGERNALMDDNRALASFIRKNPFTIEEAFFSEAESCIYDALALNRQKESITWIDKKELYLQGDFVWEKGERDTRVLFIEKANGKFKVHAKANVHDYTFYNQVEDYGTKKVPKETKKYAIAVDPFDHSITTSNERSDGAGYAYRRYDAIDELSETFLVQYINRPDKAEIFYEDMIKLAHFFGCEVLSEDNKVGLIKYFEYRGYERFLTKMPNATKYGISATVKTHQQIAEETESYITDNLKKVIFTELLDDWLHFNINKTTKFDAAMAAGYTLIAASKSKFAVKAEQKVKLYDVREIFL